MYSTAELANIVNISKDTLLRWIRTGKIPEPARDTNNFRVFTRSDLEAIWRYIEDRRERVAMNKLKRQKPT